MKTVELKKLKEQEIKVTPAEIIKFANIKAESSARLKTNIDEVDRVLGGGIMPGSIILISGEPGIGKSTIVAQIANAIAAGIDKSVIYVSGEESAGQIKERFNRLKINCQNLNFINEVNIEKTIAAAEQIKPALIIIDSIQTVYTSQIDSEPGSLNQIRGSASKLMELAKNHNPAVILVGHVTKDGLIAGPKSLEHIVDTVIYLETDNAKHFKILRATKNRFGSVNELGIFAMTGSGFKEVKNPGAIFLDMHRENLSGSILSSAMEGTRTFLIEIQALVTRTIFGYPQRKASGFDLNRLQILTAVLSKRTDINSSQKNINLANHDIILNVVGGLRVNDPALDLAVCLAITSSLLNQKMNNKTIALGEVGLGGEVRNVSKLDQRLKEAEKLGLATAIIPSAEIKTKKIKTIKVKNLSEAISLLLK